MVRLWPLAGVWPSEAAATQPSNVICISVFYLPFILILGVTAAHGGFSVGVCAGLIIILQVVLILPFLLHSSSALWPPAMNEYTLPSTRRY